MTTQFNPPPSSPSRVLIFGINYWPEQIGIAPYTTGLATHLAASGHDVTVVTGVPHYPSWRPIPEFQPTLRQHQRIDGVNIVRLRHHVPPQQTALRRSLYEATFLLNGLLPLGIRRPDAVLGVVPALSDGLLAVTAGQRWSIPAGVIVQDLMANATKQSGIDGGSRLERPTRALEGWILRRAQKIAIVADAFRPTIQSMGVPTERITEIRNWTHVQAPSRTREETRRHMGWRDDETIVLHAGNMGFKQALDSVVTAAHLAAQRHAPIRFVLMGGGSQRAALERQAGTCPNITFHDPVAGDWFPDVLVAADILLLNERRSVIDMSLPSKLTSYFAAGRPIVAAVPNGSTRSEIERAGAGLTVEPEQPDCLLGAITALAANPALQTQLAQAGPIYAETYLDRAAILERAHQFVKDLAVNGTYLASADQPRPAGVAS